MRSRGNGGLSEHAGGTRTTRRAGRWVAALTSVAALALTVAAVMAPSAGAFGFGPPGGSSSSSSSSSSGSSGSSSSSSTPACTFNGNVLPLVTGATTGSTVAISCTGEKANQLIVMVQSDLLIGLIPGVDSLFSLLSGSGGINLGSLLSALPTLLQDLGPLLGQIDLGTLHILTTNSSGDLSFNYTVPNFVTSDKNAVCPPTAQQFAEGVIGCALIMIDVSSLSLLPGGYALLSGASNLLSAIPLTQIPTVTVSPTTAAPGATVTLGEAPGHTTYWWLATLASLEGLLSGSTSAPAVTVTVNGVTASSKASVSAAVYSNGVLTPPKLSGTFVVPSSTPAGSETVSVSLTASLLGIMLPQSASTTLNVS